MKDGENKTERAILAAAEKEFTRKGFAGARTVSIAEAAGVTHAMLHYYFRTKEQLFERVLTANITAVVSSVKKAMAASAEGSITERIAGTVRSHFSYMRSHRDLALFVVNEVLSRPDRVKKFGPVIKDVGADLIGAYQEQLNDAARRGEIAEVDVFTLLFDMVSLNFLSVLAMPMFGELSQRKGDDYYAWRCEENVTIILKRLAK